MLVAVGSARGSCCHARTVRGYVVGLQGTHVERWRTTHAEVPMASVLSAQLGVHVYEHVQRRVRLVSCSWRRSRRRYQSGDHSITNSWQRGSGRSTLIPSAVYILQYVMRVLWLQVFPGVHSGRLDFALFTVHAAADCNESHETHMFTGITKEMWK